MGSRMKIKQGDYESTKDYAERLLNAYEFELCSRILNPGRSETASKRISNIRTELVRLAGASSYQSGAY